MKQQRKRRNKHDRFIIVAEKRMTRLLRQFRLLGNLANRSNYDYSQEEVLELINAIQCELEVLERRFRENLHPYADAFAFSTDQGNDK